MVGPGWGLPAWLLTANAKLWSAPRTWAWIIAGLSLAGAGTGAFRAWRLRPDDEQIALFLDHRLGAAQELPAALQQHSPQWSAHLQHRGGVKLQEALDRRLLPRAWTPRLWALPAAVVVSLLALQLPRSLPPVSAEAGTNPLKLDADEELATLEHLDEAPGLSERTRAELRAISKQSQELRIKLERGVDQREALADVAQLQNTVSESLATVKSSEQRAGLEAAVAVLRQHPATAAAASALESLDAGAFDDEVRRLSSAEERSARREAERALEKAERAALAHEAEGLARQLSEQRHLWQSRVDAAQRVHDLIREIERSAPASTDTNERAPANTQKPATGNDDGPEANLSPGSETTPAQRLAAGLEHGTADFEAPSAEHLERASRLASSAERQALTEALSQLNEPSQSARRQQALLDASQALARLQNTFSDRPTPLSSPMPGPENLSARGHDEHGAPSSGDSTARGEHAGSSVRVEADELRAKTEQSMDLRQGRVTASVGRSVGTATREMLVPTPKAIRALGPEQIESVERARVPAEYREQVSRYFSAD